MDVRQRAANYISIKPRTAMEVENYLSGKGYDEGEISQVIEELKEYRYIDDLQYCQMYFEYGFEKGRGVNRIKQELQKKGVDRALIQSVYEDLEEVPDQLEMALEICEGILSGEDISALEYEEKQRLKAKLGRRLMSKGFSTDVIYKAIGRAVE